MRALTGREVTNIAFLTRFEVDFGLLEPTTTGLGKSILDATAEYRAFLKRASIHDYATQPQGRDAKRMVPAKLITLQGDVFEAPASIYRPDTKSGDPRIWFSRLHRYCSPNDILVTLWSDETLWVLNATSIDFEDAAKSIAAYSSLLRPLIQQRGSVFEELLEMLRGVADKGFIPVTLDGNTAVGHLLESELGIRANSSKDPDYKGIELKSTRGKIQRNLTMFGQVPDWTLSQIKSSREMLARFGYERNGRVNLNCSVSGIVRNSQGLQFLVDEEAGLLHETSLNLEIPKPVTWRIQTIKDRLSEKHADTFWVKAQSRKVGGQEEIRFLTVIQTTKPILQQVGPLLRVGGITVDHLSSTDHSERGPLFKINSKYFDDLFPAPVVHDLLSKPS